MDPSEVTVVLVFADGYQAYSLREEVSEGAMQAISIRFCSVSIQHSHKAPAVEKMTAEPTEPALCVVALDA